MHPTRTYIAHLLALALTGLASTAAFADTDGVPSLQLTPTTLNFGDVTVGNSSAAATLTVQGNPGNRGFDQLANVSITLPSGWLRSGGTCPSAGAAPNPCTIGVVFSPQLVGVQNGNAQVSASVYGSNPITSTAALTGTGLPSAAVPAPSLDRLGLLTLIGLTLAIGMAVVRRPH
ncbi:MAG: choice-of-anchor D domain-containing protein [Lysobacterales bacterium]|nr:choice-of-anchor D domain-containing protein [Xanthomonadales bacterium]MCP5476091.1 choice-of-anchor D domain-containing protein [Rhodanobacteraceae bacterium]